MSEIKRNGHGAMDMTQGPPTRLIVLFSLPLLAGNVLQQLYNMVDSVVVGNYVGSSALTAVGAGFSIMFLISSLFLGFSMGATIMIAQYVGAGDQGAVGRTVDTIYSALLVIIVPLTLLGVLASGPLLTLIRVPQEAYEQARTYCMVVLGGMGSIVGVVIAATILILAPEYLRAFSEYRMLIFGAIMVIMMIFRPRASSPVNAAATASPPCRAATKENAHETRP